MVQVPAPPGTEVPQLLVCWKSPLAVMLEMFNAALPTLVSMTATGVLGLRSGSFPKSICWGLSATEGASWGLTLVTKALLLVLEPRYCHW
jgi:hypothetical protein